MGRRSVEVVVLPLVAAATMLPSSRPPLSFSSARPSMRALTRPGRVVPPPRPRRRIAPDVSLPAITAALRIGSTAKCYRRDESEGSVAGGVAEGEPQTTRRGIVRQAQGVTPAVAPPRATRRRPPAAPPARDVTL